MSSHIVSENLDDVFDIIEKGIANCSTLDHFDESSFDPDAQDERFEDNFFGDLHTEGNVGDRKGITLSWHCIKKTVVVKENNSGLLRSSISMPTKESTEEFQKVGPTSKIILNEVSASAKPGNVLALMGPSGSGKTSLLDVISGRTSFDSGIFTIGGKEANSVAIKQVKQKIGYVKQEDILFDHLTVKDQLTYTALLRLPTAWSRCRKHAEVDRLIDLLGLSKCADTLVKLISGGEKKRANIGTELLANPSVLILDEPTNGLDSSSANSLLKMLRDLAKKHNKTVITSIHQPSSAVFRSFDMLLMLVDGCVVYHGNPIDSLSYLNKQGHECPTGYNIADYWIELLSSTGAPGSSQGKDSLGTKMGLIAAWNNASFDKIAKGEKGAETSLDITRKVETMENNHIITWCTQFSILSHRSFRNSRIALMTPVRLLRCVIAGVFIGGLWFRIDYTEENVFDIAAFLFYNLVFYCGESSWTALNEFPAEREIIIKERESGTYQLSAYFLAKVVSSSPIRLFQSLIGFSISYWVSMINTSFDIFLGCTLCIMFIVLLGESIGFLFGASISHGEKRAAMMQFVLTPLNLMAGFLIRNFPSFIAWAKYLSPFKYALDASQKLIFSHDVPCDGSGTLKSVCDFGLLGFASVDEVQKILKSQGSFRFNIGILILMIVSVRFATYLSLRMKINNMHI